MIPVRAEMFKTDAIRAARCPIIADSASDIEVLWNIPNEIAVKRFVVLNGMAGAWRSFLCALRHNTSTRLNSRLV